MPIHDNAKGYYPTDARMFMNEASIRKTSTGDDIDLLLFLESGLRFLHRFKWVFIGAIVLGLAAGYAAYKGLSRVYKSTMVLHSYLLTNQELIKIAGNWNSMLAKGELDLLKKEFNCDENTLKQTKSIKADEIQKVFSPVNPHGFTITVTVANNSVLAALEKGIVHGFENSEYVNSRLTVKKERLKKLISETEGERARLDSTRRIVEKIIAGKTGPVSSIIIDGSGFNRQLVEMNEKLLAYQEELQFTRAVQVLQGFSAFNRPSGPRLVPWLIIGLAFFLSISFAYAMYRTVREKIKQRRNA